MEICSFNKSILLTPHHMIFSRSSLLPSTWYNVRCWLEVDRLVRGGDRARDTEGKQRLKCELDSEVPLSSAAQGQRH